VTAAGTRAEAAAASRQLSAEARAVLEGFPPRPVPASWPVTEADRFTVARRLLAPPFVVDNVKVRHWRKLTMLKVLDWLELYPGMTWQERWAATGTQADVAADWRWRMLAELKAAGRLGSRGGELHHGLGTGLVQLISGDVIRPGMAWLLDTTSPSRVAAEMGRTRDPAGIAALQALRESGTVGKSTFIPALERVAVIMAAKGGLVADITPGDCIELLDVSRQVFTSPTQSNRHSPFFYQLLHTAGTFPPGAPATVRMISPLFAGQLSPEQLVDRHDLACLPVRDLLVDYLRERQPGIDYGTLVKLVINLIPRFWKDLETHHPGISSLHLPPGIAAAWKKRLQTRTVRGHGGGQAVTRESAGDVLFTVRAFYLDLAQWALDDPARWGPWAVPCPIRGSDIQHKKQKSRTKARMDARTRERLPVMAALVTAADQNRKDAAARLAAARNAAPGELFTAGGQELRRARLREASPRTWAEDPATGRRRDLGREEDNAFWAWAAIEVLRHTGIRLEELNELSHHSLVQYRLPSTGELVPLLSVAPSKTDTERLLVIDPELADVLSAVITRTRGADGAIPLVPSYDIRERTWNPPMPLLFQRRIGLEHRPIPAEGIRGLLAGALAASGITGTDGKPLTYQPHDFRRIFTTDAILNGMPPHIAQLILGHDDINTTMGYKAVYPEEAINGHRAFISRRRQLRPGEEYRTPTDAEWDEFLGHFQRRRVALGDCGRAYGTTCIHEHSCIRCSLLRHDPAQRPRLEEIRANLHARIAEAEREGWAGEAEGLKISLARANEKLAQADKAAARRTEAIHLGIPAYRDIAAATLAAPVGNRDH
jgi:integrase